MATPSVIALVAKEVRWLTSKQQLVGDYNQAALNVVEACADYPVTQEWALDRIIEQVIVDCERRNK